MKRKVLSILLAATMIIGIAGCASKPTENKGSDTKETAEAGEDTNNADGAGSSDSKSSSETYELALITDVGTIDDKSFNQGSWEGLEQYAKENNITHKYYKPAEKSDEACLNAIDLAVKGGAKVIVTPGYLFEVPIFQAQDKYPEVSFILVDGAPHSGDYNITIKQNVLSIYYAEEQAGYLAGYAAVTEGYKKLGFMGGIAVPAVIRYGYGFVQGADAAAAELGISKDEIEIKYTYLGNFEATPENTAKAAAWYNGGTEVIFACGGGAGNSVMKAAESAGAKVIGVDVDQSGESETIITSAIKNLSKSVYDGIAGYYNGQFEGGQSINLTAKEEGIGLPMESSKFSVFTQEDYDGLYQGLTDGSIEIEKDTDADDPTGITTELVTVDFIK